MRVTSLRNKCIVLLYFLIHSITLHCGEQPFLTKDTTCASTNVLAMRHHFFNTVDKVLIAPDNHNNVFVCYSGYGIIKNWNYNETEPVYKQKTNIFALINIHEKIERE